MQLRSGNTISLEEIVSERNLLGFCCAAAFSVGVLAIPAQSAWAEGPGAPAKVNPATQPVTGAVELHNAAYLVREVVYNELHDHDTHGYWRFWVERHAGRDTQLAEEVETADGPMTRLEASNGQPLTAQLRQDEDRRIGRLLSSPGEQAQHLKEYTDDEHRIARILALLPDAFIYEPAEVEGKSPQMPECDCYHMHFHPNPDYPAHSIEARIFHAMAGDLWISVQNKRLVRLDGRLQENVDFGYGILGRLYKDGWFRLERTKVSSGVGNGDWKTQRLEVHMNGRAMLFKTIARETSEVRGGFTPVPPGLSLQQAAVLVKEPGLPLGVASALPASMATSR
jgi:hypothetical protein